MRHARFVRSFFRRANQRRESLSRGHAAIGILRAQQEATLDGILVLDNDGKILSLNRRFLDLWNFPPELIHARTDAELLEHALERVADPDDFVALVQEVYDDPECVRTDDLVHLRDGRDLSRTTVPVKSANQLIGRAWYFRDITDTVRADKLRSALFRITEISRSSNDLNELYGALHRIVGELMNAKNFYIALIDDTGMLDFPIFIDEVDAPPIEKELSVGLTGWVLRHGIPILATPKTVDEMVARGEIEDIGAPSVDWLGVPLKSADKTFGVLVVQSYRESERYGEQEKKILMFVSQHVAAAIEQKQKEDALRESELRYRQMFENNRAIKLVIDPANGEIIAANPAACAFYGYSESEIKQKQIWDINTMTPEQVDAAMKEALTRSQQYFIFRHKLANGEIRDVEVYSGPIEVGGRSLLYSIIHDITERKKAEKALRRSEEHFRSLIENVSDMITILDVQGTIHYTSPSVDRVIGYDAKKTVGANVFDFAHPDDAPLAARALTEAFEGLPQSHFLEFRVRHFDGTWRFLEGSAHRLEAESGERLVLNARDVTERKNAELFLQTHSAAMEASMDGIALLNEKGDFTYVNHAFLKLYNYRSRHEIIGESWTILYHRRAFPRMIREVIPSFLSRGEWRGESTGKKRDGRAFPIEISLTRIGSGSAVCVVRDITERTLAEEQIKHLAYHDALTALPNRLLFKDRLIVALSHAQREKNKLAVLFLDLDRFKIINDSLGHDAGDHLLQEVARRLSSSVRDSDTVSRLGGDEFTILINTLHSADDAARIAQKVLDAFRTPISLGTRDFHVTTSVGVSIYPDDGEDAEALLKNADTAMYQAKEHGRNNYQLFNAAINAKAVERLTVESGLRRALSNFEFVLHYQPIVSLRSGHIHGMEALVRWDHPEEGLISPATFIPVAEASGFMPQIGAWVLETACAQARMWHLLGFTNLAVAVNLSVGQLKEAGLAEQVRSVLMRTGLEPRLLEIEITESSAMQNPDANIRVLQELQNLGVRISLDDFGVGHSSLGHLKLFPLDTLKIDQSFISDIDDNDTGAIVAAIITMGHTLRLSVVAEGVELEPQRAFLSEHGCDLMQGYLSHRPMPPEQFEKVLFEHAARTGQWTPIQ